jgi:amino acid transporter
VTEPLRIFAVVALVAVLAACAWMLTRRRLKAWARETEGEPWFAPMPLLGMGIRPATWQGWLVCLAILALTFALGLLGASGAFGPGHHFGG